MIWENQATPAHPVKLCNGHKYTFCPFLDASWFTYDKKTMHWEKSEYHLGLDYANVRRQRARLSLQG